MPSSKSWKSRQQSDPYIKRAREAGYRSRAAFKLIELDEKDQLFSSGQRVVDLGAAPGGWSQIASRRVGESGKVIALDLLAMEPIPGVTFIQGDFREDEVLETLEAALDGNRVDLVLSDMAPNISGITPADQARAMYLVELALEFAMAWLKPEGRFVVKIFQGEGFEAFVGNVRGAFGSVKIRKPPASRPASREMYIVATGLK